jgi:hypothetical protein
MNIRERPGGGENQCPSQMQPQDGPGWTCCTLREGHQGPHTSGGGWNPSWHEDWHEPLYPGRCPVFSPEGEQCRGQRDHSSVAHWADSWMKITWVGRIPRTRNQRKGKRH